MIPRIKRSKAVQCFAPSEGSTAHPNQSKIPGLLSLLETLRVLVHMVDFPTQRSFLALTPFVIVIIIYLHSHLGTFMDSYLIKVLTHSSFHCHSFWSTVKGPAVMDTILIGHQHNLCHDSFGEGQA